MRDPYEVLGVPRNAGEDDIKKAYRQLSRKYHPDANINNPNKEEAEERFKEVQQAYEAIMDEREHGYSSYSGGQGNAGGYGYREPNRGYYGPFGGFGGNAGPGTAGSYDEDDVHLQAAANYIGSGHYAEALNVLGNIQNRNAKWYYYSAAANSAVGNNVTAREHARTAAQMEPNNRQYRSFADMLENGGTLYSSAGENFGGGVSGQSICSSLCFANLLCCMCTPGGVCCC